MKNRFVALAVLLTATLLAESSPQPSPSHWHGTIENITSSIFAKTLFTPPVTGQYELKLYSTIAQPDATSDALWNVGFQWYDGSGTEQAPSLQQLKSSNAFPNAWGSPNGAGGQPGSVSTFVTAKDTQVFLNVIKSHDDLAIGRIYWTIDLVQPLKTF